MRVHQTVQVGQRHAVRVPVGVAFSILALFACNDPKDANEKNFTKVINELIRDTAACFDDRAVGGTGMTATGKPYFHFPLSLASDPTTGMSYRDKNAIGHLNSFVDAGLLNASDEMVEWKNIMGQVRQVPGRVYTLTDEGKKWHHSDGAGRFCYGVAEVDEITSFTEPSDAGGRTMTSVKYTYKVDDLADWTEHDYFAPMREKVEASEDSPVPGTISLILTNNGWEPLGSHMGF